jgi:CheY-like chemotaxis protein
VCKRSFDVIVLDMRMPKESGEKVVSDYGGLVVARLLKRYADMNREVVVVVYTAFPSVADCFATVNAGAYYVPKMISEIKELVAACMRTVRERVSQRSPTAETWMTTHYPEMEKRFGGKSIALFGEGCDTHGIRTASLGGRKILVGRDSRSLRERILREPKLHEAMPLVLDIWKRA